MSRLNIPQLLFPVLLLAAPSAAHGAATEELYGNFNFLLEISGVQVAGFQEVSGLGFSTEVTEYREGGESNLVHKLPGRVKYSDITLKRGYVADDILRDWIRASGDPSGLADRHEAALVLLDSTGRAIVQYRLFNAWPCSWRGDFSEKPAGASLLEEVVICYDWFEETLPPQRR